MGRWKRWIRGMVMRDLPGDKSQNAQWFAERVSAVRYNAYIQCGRFFFLPLKVSAPWTAEETEEVKRVSAGPNTAF